MFDETIVAIATPPGTGAIAIVRVSGTQARALGSRLFRSKEPLRPRIAAYGAVLDEHGGTIDKGLALLSAAPHSYTGEDTLELHVHGSPAVAREVVRALIVCGARAADAGEFTRRAFLNGKMDLPAAAAVADLIAAHSRSAARAALANLGGGLADEVRALRARLARILEALAGAIDFPDEVPDPDRSQTEREVEALAADIRRLLREGELGRLVREGVPVAIVGPPNAGKSSLLNALLGEERAIVSEVPGTTRDTIEESIVANGLQLRLIDTAGIRAHAGRLESAGIERTRRTLAAARVVLLVIDGSQPLSDEAARLLEETRDRARVVFSNKADLGSVDDARLPRDAMRGSVFDEAAVEALRAALVSAAFAGRMPDLERPHVAAAHEFDACAQALKSLETALATLRRGDPLDLIAADLARAFAALGRVSGDDASEELIAGIFARFCIGK